MEQDAWGLEEEPLQRERGEITVLPTIMDLTEQRRLDEPTIMGACFDPTGEWLYVVGTGGIVEWRVGEREVERGQELKDD